MSDLNSLLMAIETDDISLLRQHLEVDPSFACKQVVDSKLVAETGIWLYEGDYPLHLAAALYNVDCARTLVTHGAVVDCTGHKRNSTPLHYAASGYVNAPGWNERAQERMITYLIDFGASVDVTDKNGATPLHKAVRTRCAGAVQILLAAGADVRAVSKSGSTPLHLAVQNTGRGGTGEPVAKDLQIRIVQALLDFGADPLRVDGKGKTALERAKSPVLELLST